MSGLRFTAWIIDSGRITIPKAIRDKLDLKEGDLVEVVIRPLRPHGSKPEAEVSSRPDVGALQTIKELEEMAR